MISESKKKTHKMKDKYINKVLVTFFYGGNSKIMGAFGTMSSKVS